MRRSAVALLGCVLAAPPAAPGQSAAYVGSEACVGCHDKAGADWAGSHHALAWTAPTAGNIVADFDGTMFSHDGMTARFQIGEDGSHRVSVTEKDGETTHYTVHSVAGVEPLQQYLLETGAGRLQSFDVVWDTKEGHWFHLYPDQELPPDDALHWTGPYKTWNARCAGCHATGFEKNYDPVARSYASTQTEIGVGCEACHGPGARHLAWVDDLEESSGERPANAGFAVDFSDTEATVQQCASCHARRESYQSGSPPPGTPFHDAYGLALLSPGLYHADGQIQDEVYVYGSFLQSKMYAAGVGCLDCHEPHAAELRAEGNALCVQCHNPGGNPRFPTLEPAPYDHPDHHFHEPGSEGAACINCHMTDRVYMGNDRRRDHSFRIPRPDLAAVTDAPDACTGCHSDRTARWAADRLEDWYPASTNRGPHYGEVLAAGRKAPDLAADNLADLAADTDRPGIVRATAMWLLEGSGDASAAERLEPALRDDDPLVRAGAVGVQRLAPVPVRLKRLVGLLEDPVRTVRMAAARALLDAPILHVPERQARAMRGAMDDWRASLQANLDFPETYVKLGGIALTMRDLRGAEAAFREVVRMDPQRTEGWIMLARIAAAEDDRDAARAALRDGIRANPGDDLLRNLLAEVDGDPLLPDISDPD